LIEENETGDETALKEAYEEAGLQGRLLGEPLGVYLDSREGNSVEVTVYLMEVERSLKRWPERHKRKRRFVPLSQAGRLVKNPALKEILRIVSERFSF
jgi:8-oxo-dGTP pyrophosphatase MutT (NUDIX family)